MARDEVVNFRPEPKVLPRLRELANANNRTVADELRAASTIYLLLQDLGRLRSDPSLPQVMRQKIEGRLKLEFGQVFFAAVPQEVENQFENDLEVEYPKLLFSKYSQIKVPFEALLDWLVVGKPRVQ
jgi:hypothetical protein